jgi:ADP-ribosylation factor-like protein 6
MGNITQTCTPTILKASVICVGLDNSGKSTILSHLSPSPYSQILPTSGMQLETFQKFHVDWKVWDCSGTGPSRTLWPLFYQHVTGIVFVVDASDRERVSCVKDELDAVLLSPDFRRRKMSLLILFNKMDLDDEIATVAELETVLGLSQLKSAHRNVDMHAQACSGIKGSGIEEGFRWLADSLHTIA